MRQLALALMLAASPGTSAPRLPIRQVAGPWASGHVQGIAVDLAGGYIYYSFTNLLAKYDFSGRLVGTLTGWTGHLGDLDFNAADGQIYGSLEYKGDDAFYIAMIDGHRLDRIGLDARGSDIVRTVYLPDVARDYAADLDGDGKVEDAPTRDHRYGCSGIDGVAFGPAFGRKDGKRLLTVAYGIYGDASRTDNDHQVLLQYDVADWPRYARPLIEAAPHHEGPASPSGKYFLRTGNTRYGVQNLSYDPAQRRWFLGVYKGAKLSFPNYLLFAVDAEQRPVVGDLVGVPGTSAHSWARGTLLSLARDGLWDRKTGIHGWHWKADVGFQPVGHSLYYLSNSAGSKDRQTATLTLMHWTGRAERPFAPVEFDGKPRVSAVGGR